MLTPSMPLAKPSIGSPTRRMWRAFPRDMHDRGMGEGRGQPLIVTPVWCQEARVVPCQARTRRYTRVRMQNRYAAITVGVCPIVQQKKIRIESTSREPKRARLRLLLIEHIEHGRHAHRATQAKRRGESCGES
jgi:hypothetical protein